MVGLVGVLLMLELLDRFSSLCLGEMVVESLCSIWLVALLGVSCCCWIAWSFWYSVYLPSWIETLRKGEVSFSDSERLG